MAHITVIGGTGYAGSAIAAEASQRGHNVTVVSRRGPRTAIPDVTYVNGSAFDADVQDAAFADADAVVLATSPRGDMAGRQLELAQALASRAEISGVRLIVVGGFSSLRPAPGAPRFIEGEIPPQFRDEALAGHSVLEMLLDAPEGPDWTFVSPAAVFGAYAPGEPTGSYRLGGEIAIMRDEGGSRLSAPDLALAVVDLVDAATHRREHVSVVA